MPEYDLQVIGMSCNACEITVSRAVSQVEGVATADADADENRLLVTGTPHLHDRICQSIYECGYAVE